MTSRRLPPLFRRRWYYVETAQRASFEKRAVRAHVLSMLTVVVGVQFMASHLAYGMLLLTALLVLVVIPGLQVWMTTGLTLASLAVSPLAPRSLSEEALIQARALGMRTLWGFLVLGVLLTIPQGFVAITEGAWWAWMGVILFGSCTIYFARQIVLLRAEGTASQAR